MSTPIPIHHRVDDTALQWAVRNILCRKRFAVVVLFQFAEASQSELRLHYFHCLALALALDLALDPAN